MKTPEHTAYCEHVKACEVVERGRWCPECRDLLRAADSADWAVVGATSRERATVAA